MNFVKVKAENPRSRSVVRQELRMVGWEKQESGWVKVNMDGAAKDNSRLTGAGGIIRDEVGGWLGDLCKILVFRPP